MKKLDAATLVALLPALALLAGCETKLDDEKVKQALVTMFKEQLALEVTGVVCPKDVKVKAGNTMECDVAVKGGHVPVVITMKDDDGNIDLKTKQDVILNAKLAASIAENIGLPVDCGTEVRLAKPGLTFACTAAGDRKIEVTIDDKGISHWKVVGGRAPEHAPDADADAAH